ncbi:MAG: nitrile hydratase accessory protein [Acidimicrobiia bacterium]|nr:nitrile hydratase accessory protein [Acidimicrobiia bacterium]
MSDTAALADQLPIDGPGAPPRSNGELVFDAPWEGRVFGIAVALAEAGVFTLADLQAELIAAIARWEALGEPVENYRYYECWLAALERLVVGQTPLSIDQIDERSEQFVARPAGHDHEHDHDHHH